MVSKLLVNGCSFIAGDAITWHRHHPNIPWRFCLTTDKKQQRLWVGDADLEQVHKLFDDYRKNLRPKDNFGAKLSNALGVELIDLSQDGNSNDNICRTTIAYLNELGTKEKQQIHVCIGWTSVYRRMKFDREDPNLWQFINLIPNFNSVGAEYQFKNFVRYGIVEADDYDHLYNYLHNVAYLQSYLRQFNIKFTFFRSLYENITIDCNQHIFNTDRMFHLDDWYSFDPKLPPWIGATWMHELDNDKARNFVEYPHHAHPSEYAVRKLVKNLVPIISKKL